MYSLILYGRRSIIELQKWRNLRVSVNFNSFSSASVANVSPRDGRNVKISTVSYLVDSLGLTTKLAESISRKVSFEDKRNPDSVLNLFKSHGFTNCQISSIISDYPGLLIADAEKSLGPKLQFLHSRGASTSELTVTLSKVPKILIMKGNKTISRYYDFVKEIIEADKSSKYVKLCHSLPQGGKQENMIKNVLVLRELGVPQKNLFSLLFSNFKTLCGKERFGESLKKVVEMGFDPTTSKFVQALIVVYGFKNETIEEKVNVYKRLGLAVDDVWAMFKKGPVSLRHSEKKITQQFETLKKCGLLEDEVLSVFKYFPQCIGVSEQKILSTIETFLGLGFSRDEFLMMVKRFPPCIGLSAETVKKKTEFLVKKMNWPLKKMVLFPQCLGYSMEKRLVPRCNVIKALLSKRLLGRSEVPSMAFIFSCTDEAFVNRFVMMSDDKHPELGLMAIFTENKSKTSE